jgi:hypothetical protein
VTPVEVTFNYDTPPGENELRALDQTRDVYGVRKISFKEGAHAIGVEYDASRLTKDDVAALLREAGFDIHKQSEIAVMGSETVHPLSSAMNRRSVREEQI